MRLDRLNSMEEYILDRGTVSLTEMKEHFNMSTNTIRRDIDELIKRGHIKKVYGGVTAVTTDAPMPISFRRSRNQDGKEEIGVLAREFVNDGEMIFLDSGSTVLYMLPYLRDMTDLTIVTHNLSAMLEVAKYPNLKLIALGGMYNASTSSFIGITTEETLQRYNFGTVFICATGVSLEKGLTNTTYVEAEIKRKVVEKADRVILLADHTKFGISSTISFFPFEKLYAIVTDRKPSEEFLKVIEENNIILSYQDQ